MGPSKPNFNGASKQSWSTDQCRQRATRRIQDCRGSDELVSFGLETSSGLPRLFFVLASKRCCSLLRFTSSLFYIFDRVT